MFSHALTLAEGHGKCYALTVAEGHGKCFFFK